MKEKFFLGITAVFGFLIATIGGVHLFSASAEGTVTEETAIETSVEEVSSTTVDWLQTSFTMDFGASTRVGQEVTDENGNKTYENYGIRFSVTAIDDAGLSAFANLANSDAVVGVLIAPYSTIKSVTTSSGITDKNLLLTASTVFEQNLFTFAETGKEWTNNTIYNIVAPLQDTNGDGNVDTLHGALVNLYTANFLQKYTGRAYVGVPETAEDGSVSYTYYFAKYALGEDPITGEAVNDVSHNTRCMYYVAQRAVENGDAQASILKTTYIDHFAETYPDTVNNQQFKYTTVHHYVDSEGNETREVTYAGATLAATGVGVTGVTQVLQATASEKTVGDIVYVVNTTATGLLDRGYLYAASMTYLHVYYTTTTLKEINQAKTNDMLAEMGTKTDEYFGNTLTVDSSDLNNPILKSGEDRQENVIFTEKFIYDLQTAGFTTIYIENAELYTDIGSMIEAWTTQVKIDAIQVSIGDAIQILDAAVVGYTAKEHTIFGFNYAYTITFTGITIILPTELVDTEDEEQISITLTAYVGDTAIAGTWTLTGVLFG